MNGNLLFFDIDYVGEKLTMGYYLFEPSLRFIKAGETSSPEEICDLLEENLPVTYDFSYLYRDVECFYDYARRKLDPQKPFLCLYEYYRFKRHIHFYVDIVECLGRMDRSEEEIFPFGDSLGPKDRARLNKMVYEELERRYGRGVALYEHPAAVTCFEKTAHIDEGMTKRDYLIREKMPLIRQGEAKKYVFFDIECANTDFEEGKICEFSYVVYDSSWKLLEEREILINPGSGEDNDFKLIGRPESSDLHLKYETDDYKAYRQSPEFGEFAKEILALLSDKDTLLFGYEVESDLRFLNYSFSRYGVDAGNLFAVDVKRVYQEILQRSMRSLGDLVDRYVPKEEAKALQFHAAIDDAKATGLVLKYFLLMNGMSLHELLDKVDEDVLCESSTSFYPTPDLADPVNYERLKKDGMI